MALLAVLPKVCTCVTVVAVVTVPIPPVVEQEGAGGMVHAVGGPHFRKVRQPLLALKCQSPVLDMAEPALGLNRVHGYGAHGCCGHGVLRDSEKVLDGTLLTHLGNG